MHCKLLLMSSFSANTLENKQLFISCIKSINCLAQRWLGNYMYWNTVEKVVKTNKQKLLLFMFVMPSNNWVERRFWTK